MIAMKESVVINMDPILIRVQIAPYKSICVELSLEGAELIGSKVTRQ